MPDTTQTGLTVGSIAEMVGGSVEGRDDLTIRWINALEDAGADELTFITDQRRAGGWSASRARVALVTRGIKTPGHDPAERALIIVDNAETALIDVMERLQPAEEDPQPGVHPSAVIDPSAQVDPAASIGAHVTIGPRTTIAARAVLYPGVCIGADVTIGEGSVIRENSVLRARTVIGREVIIHQNVSVGADGFGYRPAADGSGLRKVPHLGHVEVGDRVELGAGVCIDRGKFGATTIGEGTKIDNLVQIAHNCRIGRSTVIAAMSGIAGSARIGDGVMIGGGVLISDHVRIGNGARIAGGSACMMNVADNQIIAGAPADDHREALRQWAAVRKLPAWMRDVDARLGRTQGTSAPERESQPPAPSRE